MSKIFKILREENSHNDNYSSKNLMYSQNFFIFEVNKNKNLSKNRLRNNVYSIIKNIWIDMAYMRPILSFLTIFSAQFRYPSISVNIISRFINFDSKHIQALLEERTSTNFQPNPLFLNYEIPLISNLPSPNKIKAGLRY